MVAYGERITATLLNSGLADEIVVVTLPKVAGGEEKALQHITGDGTAWVVRSCKVLDGEKVRTTALPISKYLHSPNLREIPSHGHQCSDKRLTRLSVYF